jgi:Glucose dehydrogenase C-terminus
MAGKVRASPGPGSRAQSSARNAVEDPSRVKGRARRRRWRFLRLVHCGCARRARCTAVGVDASARGTYVSEAEKGAEREHEYGDRAGSGSEDVEAPSRRERTASRRASSAKTGTKINRQLVLENAVVFGSVSANLSRYRREAGALARADRGWLSRMITPKEPLDRWREEEEIEGRPGDVKAVITFREFRE